LDSPYRREGSDSGTQPDVGQLDCRLCLRRYPIDPDVGHTCTLRIGAHIDSTVFTLLWANGPGLEVLLPFEDDDTERPSSSWTAQQVMNIGLPMSTTDELRDVDDDDWARIELPWEQGMLLFTVGLEWLSCKPLMERMPMACAVLHRVSVPNNGLERLSLPLLVNLVSQATSR